MDILPWLYYLMLRNGGSTAENHGLGPRTLQQTAAEQRHRPPFGCIQWPSPGTPATQGVSDSALSRSAAIPIPTICTCIQCIRIGLYVCIYRVVEIHIFSYILYTCICASIHRRYMFGVFFGYSPWPERDSMGPHHWGQIPARLWESTSNHGRNGEGPPMFDLWMRQCPIWVCAKIR